MSVVDELRALREAAAADPGVPEPVRRFLAGGAPLEEIRLDALGRWIHEGERFENVRLAQLFHRSLSRTPAGTWVLRIGPYTYPVLVDDCGRFATRLVSRDDGEMLVLADGGEVSLRSAALLTDGDRWLGFCDADGSCVRIVGDAYRALLDRIETTDDGGWMLRDALGGRPIEARARNATSGDPDGQS